MTAKTSSRYKPRLSGGANKNRPYTFQVGWFFGRMEYMEEEILKKIEAQDKKLEDIYNSIEKMRKYFLWTLIVTIAVIILPLIGILLLIPKFLSTLSGSNLGL